MSSEFDYDLLVIGAGSGGVRCARVAAQLGASVAIVESRYLGGTCVNVGCVPKKLFVYASQFPELMAAAQGFGWDFEQRSFDWPQLRDNKTNEISRLNGIYEGLLDKVGATIIRGHGKLLGGNRVEVEGQIITARFIVLATGGWPKKNQYPGAEFAVTSNEVFSLSKWPKRVLVEGGGYIAVEFAGIFNGLGCDTRLIYRSELFLRGFDQDVRVFLAEEMRKKHLSLDFQTEIQSIEKLPDEALCVTFTNGQQTTVDLVFSAIGRTPMVDNLGLEHTQVQLNGRGEVQVNDQFQTADPHIFALGDLVGRLPLTPVALREGTALAKFLFANTPVAMRYDGVPTAVFSQPEVATVGLTEEQARARYVEIEVFNSQFRPLKHTLSGLSERTLMKLVVDKASQRVLGCHMVGEHAAEIMQGVAIAVNMGATKQQFDDTIGIHPSAAEEFVTMR